MQQKAKMFKLFQPIFLFYSVLFACVCYCCFICRQIISLIFFWWWKFYCYENYYNKKMNVKLFIFFLLRIFQLLFLMLFNIIFGQIFAFILMGWKKETCLRKQEFIICHVNYAFQTFLPHFFILFLHCYFGVFFFLLQ